MSEQEDQVDEAEVSPPPDEESPDTGGINYAEAESAVIRSAFADPHAFRASLLDSSCFDDAYNRSAWDAIVSIRDTVAIGESCSSGTLHSALMMARDDKYVWDLWINRFMSLPKPDPRYVLKEYAPVLYQRRQMRLWKGRVDVLSPRVGAVTEDQKEVYKEFGRRAKEITDATLKDGPNSCTKGLVNGWNPDPDSGGIIIPTGITQIDSRIGGGCGPGDVVMIGGGTGDGKCERKGTILLSYDGTLKEVEKFVVGDLLMGPDGKPRRVLRTNNGRGEMFEIRPVRGGSFFCNEDHVLTLVGTGRPAHNRAERHEEVGCTRHGGKVVDVSVREWMTWSKKRKHMFKLMRPPAVEFGGEKAELPIDPYFLGVIIGDGSLTANSVIITKPDREIRDEVHNQATRLGMRVTEWTGSTGCPNYRMARVDPGQRNALIVQLEHLGLMGTGAGEKFIPAQYKVASRADRLAILAGLMDTDGAMNKSAYDWISKSKQLAEDVTFVARSLGMAAYVSPCEKGCQTGAVGTYYRVGISGDAVADIPIRIKRKRPWKRAQKKDVLRVGFTIIPTGEEDDYYGFTLDGDGRYLHGDFTVTHNSYSAYSIMDSRAALRRRTLYLSCEDPDDLIRCRIISRFCDPPLPSARIREKRREDVDNVEEAKRLHAIQHDEFVYAVACRRATLSRIVDLIRTHRFIYGCDVFIVDYIQAIRSDDPEVINKTQVVGEALDALKTVADECGMVGIILSQYVRDDYKDGKEPDMYSFKYSGDAENIAEAAVLYWRDPPGTQPRLLHCKIAKLKWAQVDADTMRYTVARDSITGHHAGWHVDDTPPGGDEEDRDRGRGQGQNRQGRPGGNRNR